MKNLFIKAAKLLKSKPELVELEAKLQDSEETLNDALNYIANLEASIRGQAESIGLLQQEKERQWNDAFHTIVSLVTHLGGSVTLGKDLCDSVNVEHTALKLEKNADDQSVTFSLEARKEEAEPEFESDTEEVE